MLAVAVARVAVDAIRSQAPLRPAPRRLACLAFAAIVCLYALIPQDVLDEAGAKAVMYGPARADPRRRLLPRPLARARPPGAAPPRLGAARRRGGARRGRTRRPVRRRRRVVAKLWGGRLLPLRARVRLSRAGRTARQLGVQYRGRSVPPPGRELHQPARNGVRARRGAALRQALPGRTGGGGRSPPKLVALCAAALLFTLSRSSLLALAGAFVVLAVALELVAVAATAVVLAAGVGFAFAFTSVAPETHFFPEDLPYQGRAGPQARRPSRRQLARAQSWRAIAAEPLAEPPRWDRDRLRAPTGYGLGNAGAIAVRFGVPLRAGESNYTETGVETGLAGALLFIVWSLALLLALVRAAWAAGDGVSALRHRRCRGSPGGLCSPWPCRPMPTACPGSPTASGGSAGRLCDLSDRG